MSHQRNTRRDLRRSPHVTLDNLRRLPFAQSRPTNVNASVVLPKRTKKEVARDFALAVAGTFVGVLGALAVGYALLIL